MRKLYEHVFEDRHCIVWAQNNFNTFDRKYFQSNNNLKMHLKNYATKNTIISLVEGWKSYHL